MSELEPNRRAIRRTRIRRVAVIVLGVIALTAGALIRSRLDEWVRYKVESGLSAAFEGETRIGAVELHLLAGRVVIRDVVLSDTLESGRRLEIAVPEASVGIARSSLPGLLVRRLHLTLSLIHI